MRTVLPIMVKVLFSDAWSISMYMSVIATSCIMIWTSVDISNWIIHNLKCGNYLLFPYIFLGFFFFFLGGGGEGGGENRGNTNDPEPCPVFFLSILSFIFTSFIIFGWFLCADCFLFTGSCFEHQWHQVIALRPLVSQLQSASQMVTCLLWGDY